MAKTISSPTSQPIIPVELIERHIYVIRGQKVMLDADLAGLYQVRTKRLNEAVKRNANRFPEDFMFQLGEEELARKIDQLEASQRQQSRTQAEHGSILVAVVQDIQRLKHPPTTRAIGFIVRSPKKK